MRENERERKEYNHAHCQYEAVLKTAMQYSGKEETANRDQRCHLFALFAVKAFEFS